MNQLIKGSTIKLTLGKKTEAVKIPNKIRLFKKGPNETTKGIFTYNEELIELIQANSKKDGRDQLPIDIAHLSILGSPDPKAHESQGWFTLSFEEDGLYATDIEWSDEAEEKLKQRKFRFISPAFDVNQNNEIVYIDNFALTNEPATYGLEPIVASKENSKEEQTLMEPEIVEEEIKTEEQLAEEVPVEDKDQMILDLKSEVERLQSELMQAREAMASMQEKELEVSKEAELSQIELTAEKKAFFKKLSLDEIKEFVALSKTDHKEEVAPTVKPPVVVTIVKKPEVKIQEKTILSKERLDEIKANTIAMMAQKKTVLPFNQKK